jgi:hypothetical protein
MAAPAGCTALAAVAASRPGSRLRWWLADGGVTWCRHNFIVGPGWRVLDRPWARSGRSLGCAALLLRRSGIRSIQATTFRDKANPGKPGDATPRAYLVGRAAGRR